jgi:hypothetical protein
MAELSKKLQLTDTQKKQLAPIVEQRDREAKALNADTLMGKLQKLRQGRRQTKTLLPTVMTYEIEGSNVTLSLSADELNEVIDALETVNSESKLLEAWYEFLQRGVCLILQTQGVPYP